jgi:hypothetical protein
MLPLLPMPQWIKRITPTKNISKEAQKADPKC